MKNRIRLVMILGVLSLIAGVLGHLALTDIYHGEGDLRLEWTLLRVFALIFLIFTGCTLTTLRSILRTL